MFEEPGVSVEVGAFGILGGGVESGGLAVVVDIVTFVLTISENSTGLFFFLNYSRRYAKEGNRDRTVGGVSALPGTVDDVTAVSQSFSRAYSLTVFLFRRSFTDKRT